MMFSINVLISSLLFCCCCRIIVVSGELSAIAYENLLVENGIPENAAAEHRPVMSLLLPNMHNPSYARSFKGERAVAKGSLFITITCVEIPTTESIEAGGSRHSNQFARFDVPLKLISTSKLKASNFAKMGVPTIESALLEKLNQFYNVATFSCAPKPFVMIPYSKSNVEVRMTLSEVSEWPKSYVIGQCNQSLRSSLEYYVDMLIRLVNIQ